MKEMMSLRKGCPRNLGYPLQRETMALRQERQAIFLGATEPTPCPTGKEPAPGSCILAQTYRSMRRTCSGEEVADRAGLGRHSIRKMGTSHAIPGESRGRKSESHSRSLYWRDGG
jgi:hypothetical protein